MKAKNRLTVGVSVLVLGLLFGATLAGTAEAKKKNRCRQVTVGTTGSLGVPIGSAASGIDGTLTVPLSPPAKKTRGCAVSGGPGLSITYQFTGPAGSLNALTMWLTSPDGTTINVDVPGLTSTTNIGPFTQAPNSSNLLCFALPCTMPRETVRPPLFQGIANLDDLPMLRGVPTRGQWTVFVDNANTTKPGAVLNSVRLDISQAKLK